MRPITPFRGPTLPLLAFGALTQFIAGCRTYEAKPLDLETVRRALVERPAAVIADPVDGLLPLSLADAERATLLFNPSLRLARLDAGIARAAADASGMASRGRCRRGPRTPARPRSRPRSAR